MDKMADMTAPDYDYIIGLRRYFRMHPEIGGEEHQTQQKIMTELCAMGLEPRMAAGTGVIADIKGGLPGKTVALRCDIDALPIQDESDQPYRSRLEGKCHACGHDAHMAMVLGAARALAAQALMLPGNVRLIFQPSEERFPGGAEAMIRDGAMQGVDTVLGAHVWQPFGAGTIGISFGRAMASPDEYTITIQGKGGHGSMPHQTVDPILVGAQIVIALKSVVGTHVDPLEQAVVSLGMFKAGEVFNIIPDTAVLKGTVRSFDQKVRIAIFNTIEQIVGGICQAAGASYVLEKFLGYPPVINDCRVAQTAFEAARETLGESGVFEMGPVMAGEDFSYYLQQAPGAFIFIGVGNPDKGIVYPHHHPRFDMDEAALGPGTAVIVKTVVKLLGQ